MDNIMFLKTLMDTGSTLQVHTESNRTTHLWPEVCYETQYYMIYYYYYYHSIIFGWQTGLTARYCVHSTEGVALVSLCPRWFTPNCHRYATTIKQILLYLPYCVNKGWWKVRNVSDKARSTPDTQPRWWRECHLLIPELKPVSMFCPQILLYHLCLLGWHKLRWHRRRLHSWLHTHNGPNTWERWQ